MQTNSLPTICQQNFSSEYDFESANNNAKMLEMLQKIFPGVINPEDVKFLLMVQNSIDILRKTVGGGELMVCFQPGHSSVEFKGRFFEKQTKL